MHENGTSRLHAFLRALPVSTGASIVMGSGLRRIAADLGDRFEKVLADTERWIGEQRVRSVRVSINFASAGRDASW